VLDLVGSSVIGDRRFFAEVFAGFLAGGHVLIEDVPGTGKTLTASSFAEALGLEFNRVQFTPDLLPTDITGTNVYDQQQGTFEFSEGPLFANVVLADEINRAPPKTQAALLEAMEERQVTADGTTRELPKPFFVIATQTPVEQEGPFTLPEAQVDRFIVKTAMGYPDVDGAMELLERREARETSTPSIDGTVDRETVQELRRVPETVRVSTEVKRYMIDVVERTREEEYVEIGVSPRGLQRLYEAARARAVMEGRDYVVPGDVTALARPVLAHRLVLTTEATVRSVRKADVIDSVLDSVEVPAAEGDPPGEDP
jgi:MoxR-like ATPase